MEGTVIRFECERVPRQDAVPGATRVPCLGGLGTDVLVKLAAAADGRAIRLMDRGWCAACPAGGQGLSLDEVIAPGRAVLAAAGCDSEGLPTVERRPLPIDRRTDESGPKSTLSRRALFRRLSRNAPERLGGDGVFPLATRRLTENDTVRRLAERNGRSLPAIFPRAFISESCVDHRICAAACPTGALAAHEQESARDVVFRPDRCLVCGRCEDVCPTHSIHVAATGGNIDKTTLAVRELSCCPECEEEFFDHDGTGLCAACRKERSILSSPLTPRMSIQDIEESAP